MATIPFVTSSTPGNRAQEGAGRLINIYAEKSPAGARGPVTWKRSPGTLLEHTVTGEVHCRGMISGDAPGLPSLDGVAYIVFDGEVFAFERVAAGTWVGASAGALTGTRPVTLAKNAKAAPNYVACKPEGGAFVLTSSSVTAYSSVDTDLPTDVNSVAHLNGYFLWTKPVGQIWASDLNSTAVTSTSFTTADRSPDGLLRGVAFRGEYFAFGPSSCQAYRDVGSSPFPLEYVTTIPRGLKGTHAIAGQEEGWSNELIWAADDNIVYRLEGYAPVPISNDDVSRAIATSTDYRLLEAIVYKNGKNAFWALTSPGEWTWEYNLTTNEWNERVSNGRNDWRASASLSIGGVWIVGDRTTGKLGKISASTYQELADTLTWTMESGPVHQFPGRVAIPRADFDFVQNTTASTVDISWSTDGGVTYGTAVSRDLTAKVVSVLRAGQANPKGTRFKMTGSSNAPISFMGGQCAAIARAA